MNLPFETPGVFCDDDVVSAAFQDGIARIREIVQRGTKLRQNFGSFAVALSEAAIVRALDTRCQTPTQCHMSLFRVRVPLR